MSYEYLTKLYYGDKETYLRKYEERLASENTVMLDFEIKGRQAFYVLAPDVARLTLEILRADKRISQLISVLPGAAIKQFTRRCLIDEIVVTNRIEGVHSTRREISDIIEDLETNAEKKGKHLRFVGLVDKYLMLQEGKEIPLKTCRDIRELYDELVLPEVVAEDERNRPDGEIFRKESASVRTGTDKEIHRGVYPEREIIAAMEKALAFLWDEKHEALHRICLFHYLLEYIHPFYDGNGRTGRFIVSYLLSKELEPLLAYRLSVTLQENIADYYKAFEIANDPHGLGDVTPFLLIMLTLVKKATEQLEEALSKRFIQLDKYRKLIYDLPGAERDRTARLYDLLIQAGLFSEHGVGYDTITVFLSCSRSTAAKELEELRKTGLLKVERIARASYFLIDIEKLDESTTKNE